MVYVSRPRFIRLNYDRFVTGEPSLTISHLMTILEQEERQIESSAVALEDFTLKGLTNQAAVIDAKGRCIKDLRYLVNKAMHVQNELGAWSVEDYLSGSITRIATRANWGGREQYQSSMLIAALSRSLQRLDTSLGSDLDITPKVKQLIHFLAKEENETFRFSGIIFVKERVIVTALKKLISAHPLTKDCLRCGSFVGQSQRAGGKAIAAESFDLKVMLEDLVAFRDGRKNLMITTDVLEEGIDVTVCHLVVCFDEPPSFKSFLQRRGRARRTESKFVIMTEDGQPHRKIETWRRFEKEMIEAYQNEKRQHKAGALIESSNENVEFRLHIESTGYEE